MQGRAGPRARRQRWGRPPDLDNAQTWTWMARRMAAAARATHQQQSLNDDRGSDDADAHRARRRPVIAVSRMGRLTDCDAVVCDDGDGQDDDRQRKHDSPERADSEGR